MALPLEVDKSLTAGEAQLVKDGEGAASPLALSSTAVGIGTTVPEHAELQIQGNVHLERNGSPRLSLRSRGNGTQWYSIRATNDRDSAGGRKLVIRNEDTGRDVLIVDGAGDIFAPGDVRLERGGSPRLSLRSRGNGTQWYSIRATNDQDGAGGRSLVIRNEDQSRDELILDHGGNLRVAGDILLTGADCAEKFAVDDLGDVHPGQVLVIDSGQRLRPCTEPYDNRVAGVVSGAGDLRAGIVMAADQRHHDHVPVALTGRVYCQADADYAPIGAGDLLTTSPSAGYAMKASDRRKSLGAILGKALNPLSHGRTLIPVLVALQ
jgi:hypothetical protein